MDCYRGANELRKELFGAMMLKQSKRAKNRVPNLHLLESPKFLFNGDGRHLIP